MSLGEGASCRIAYKAYSTGAIQSNVQPDSSINPGATDGQILRRTSSTLSLTKETYQSAEVRTDRQIGDYRHGVKRVTGSINGELSPGTYWDFVEAVLRGTETAGQERSGTYVRRSGQRDKQVHLRRRRSGDRRLSRRHGDPPICRRR